MGGRLDLVTRGPDETREVGASLAELLVPGDVVSLTGDLGAGKTCLVQGAARSLGVEEPVGSPTFVLVREYRGDVPVYHLDVYRLDRLQEVLDLGFEDLLDPGGVIFIEWGDVINALLPDSYLEVELSIPEEEEIRRLAVTGRGTSWAHRWERLEKALDGWRAA
jgi:tRNA threonylcarbamoyladenosine biosynthesis protein TsaE